MSKKGLKIIVVGAGKVGDTLVNRLAEEGHDLVIIDKNVERLTELANLCDCMGIIGNGASHEVLALPTATGIWCPRATATIPAYTGQKA